MGEVRGLTIVVGEHAEVPEDMDNKPVILGICQDRNKEKGCYAQGCPGARIFRGHVARVSTPDEFREVVQEYFPRGPQGDC